MRNLKPTRKMMTIDDNTQAYDESNSKRPGPPFVVKFIDFAHTRFAPSGPTKMYYLGWTR